MAVGEREIGPLACAPDELVDFINVLRLRGYGVGTQQCLSAQRLLIALTARTDFFERPREFASFLAPVLCSTPEEQELFPKLYDEWLSSKPRLFSSSSQQQQEGEAAGVQGGEAATTRARKPGASQTATPAARWFVYAATLFVLVTAAAAYKWGGVLLEWGGQTSNTGGKNTDASYGWIPLVVWAAAVTGLIIAFVAIRLRGAGARAGSYAWPARQPPRAGNPAVREAASHLLPSVFPPHRTAREWFRQRSHKAEELNVEKTVEETARSVLFTPVYATRKSRPEYLVLIDRESFGDSLAGLFRELTERLAGRDAFVERYYFQRDPRVCRSEGPMAPYLRLEDLAARHPDCSLLVFSDAGNFFSPVDGRPREWLKLFDRWETRLLLTPRLRPDAYRERALTRSGFTVLPAAPESLAPKVGDTRTDSTGFVAEPERVLPPALRGAMGLRFETSFPTEAEAGELCRQLKTFLGDEGYYWLGACAAHPFLSWDLALYLASELNIRRGNFSETYLKLLRLPWFRSGRMPEWLSERLEQELTFEQKQSILAAFDKLCPAPSEVTRQGLSTAKPGETRAAHAPAQEVTGADDYSPLRLMQGARRARGKSTPAMPYALLDDSGYGAFLVKTLMAIVVLIVACLLLILGKSVNGLLYFIFGAFFVVAWGATATWGLRRTLPAGERIFDLSHAPDARDEPDAPSSPSRFGQGLYINRPVSEMKVVVVLGWVAVGFSYVVAAGTLIAFLFLTILMLIIMIYDLLR
jgi:hypothetical protein